MVHVIEVFGLGVYTGCIHKNLHKTYSDEHCVRNISKRKYTTHSSLNKLDIQTILK